MSVSVSSSIIPSLMIENALKCPQCPKTCPTPKILQHHQQMFHTDKAFICETCGKAFRFRSNLAEHRSVHTSHKPYKCKYCDKSSRLKGNLTKHILKHHKKEHNEAISKDDIIVIKRPKTSDNEASTAASSTAAVSPPVLSTINNNNIKLEVDDSSFYGILSTPSNENTAPGGMPKEMTSEQERSILISLGLDYSGSIDLRDTPETSISPETFGAKVEMDSDLCYDSPLPQDTIGGEQSLAALIAQVSNGSPDSGKQGTQCPECGKHVRKSSYLPVHMSLQHGFPPPDSGASSDERNSEDFQSASEDNVQGELRAIATAICDLKAQQLTTPKIEQLLSGIDIRVSRLEKNLDMALNSIYTLVQLQTGINSSVNRFKEDAATKLHDIKIILERATTE